MTSRPPLTEAPAVWAASLLAACLRCAIRAVIIMFVAAVIAKRFDVFASIGYVESLAWAAGWGLLIEVVSAGRGE